MGANDIKRTDLPCTVVGCENKNWARGFCHKHYQKLRTYGDPLAGATHRQKGAGTIDKRGYHSRTIDGTGKLVHVLMAEKAIGRTLPVGAEVHHVDRNPSNNAPSNLVVCPNSAYHRLLHQRQRALDACGNANWRVCCRCGNHDAPENLNFSGKQAYHAECNRLHVAAFKAKKAML